MTGNHLRRHVRNQDPLGSDPRRFCNRAHDHMGATQWTAWRLGYQFQLGSPWVVVATLPLYPPPAFFWWWFSFDAYAPRFFFEGAVIAAAGGFVAIIGAIAISVWRAREAKNIVTSGSALVRDYCPGEYTRLGSFYQHDFRIAPPAQ